MKSAGLQTLEFSPRPVFEVARLAVKSGGEVPVHTLIDNACLKLECRFREAWNAFSFLRSIGFLNDSGRVVRDGSSLVGFDQRDVTTAWSALLAERGLNFAAKSSSFVRFVNGLSQESALILNPITMPWRFRSLRDLWILCGVLVRVNGQRQVFSSEFEALLRKKFENLPSEAFLHKKRVSPNEFNRRREQQELTGLHAEEFVLRLERRRLLGSGLSNRIEHTATIDVAAGYDIASFNSPQSVGYDRFLEVKSYSGQPLFYWSENERRTAALLGHKYVLVLVNREKFSDGIHACYEIADPQAFFDSDLSDAWKRTESTIMYELK